MNADKWIKEVIKADRCFNVPIMTHPGIEMTGATVKEVVTDGEKHAKAIYELSKAYPSDAATVIMDLTVEAEAFGSVVEFPQDDMPHVIGNLVDASTVEALQVPSVSAGRVPEYLRANRVAVELIKDRPVFAGAIGPFSLAGRLYGMSEIMVDCYLEPDAITMLLEKCTQFIGDYCVELKKTGCRGVIIAEPAAGLLSNDDCMMYSSVYLKTIIERVQDEDFMVVLHNCGNMGQCTDAMVATGAKAYHFGNAVKMTDVIEQCPTDALVMGNIDPVGVMRMMSPDQVKGEVRTLLESVAQYPNFVLSTGCDTPPHLPEENIKAYYEAWKEFNDR